MSQLDESLLCFNATKEYQQLGVIKSPDHCSRAVSTEQELQLGNNSDDGVHTDDSEKIARLAASSSGTNYNGSQMVNIEHPGARGVSTRRETKDEKTRLKHRMLRKRQSEKLRRGRLSSAYGRLVQVLFQVDPDFKRILNARSQRQGSNKPGYKLLESVLSSLESDSRAGTEVKRHVSYLFSQHELLEQAANALERFSNGRSDFMETQSDKQPAKSVVDVPVSSGAKDNTQADRVNSSFSNPNGPQLHRNTPPSSMGAMRESVASSSSNSLDSTDLLALLCGGGGHRQHVTSPITTTRPLSLLPPGNKTTGPSFNPALTRNLTVAHLVQRAGVSKRFDGLAMPSMFGIRGSTVTPVQNSSSMQSPAHRFSHSHLFWRG